METIKDNLNTTTIVESQVIETQVIEKQVVETQVVETPVVETPVVENTVSDNSNIYNETVRLMLDIIGNDEKIKQYNIVIDNKTNNILMLLIKSNPLLFSEIQDTLIKIIKDEKIDSNDIPEILVLLKKLYEIVYSLKKTKISGIDVAKITGDILKFLVLILIKENKIKVNNEEDFLKNINQLIDISISLLSLNKTLKKSYGCNNFLKLFKKK